MFVQVSVILFTGGVGVSAPGGCLVQGVVCSRRVPAPRAVPGPGGPGGDPSWMATAAGGTHPTGMHSCS